ncbi:MAG: hypothetical protein BXU00_02945 [Candidatus Nanoclepta minutus]|uniref:30S ribosomal protein S3Ae n=1 Tax=Candidatus Nanoclepta minutus TaxID=1940235 RepID=A0A397WMJ2_9ARCH|nr:MAG: hypothetical protein BXU00_02945 [Candidatus Nanoclepta minutus]
MAYNKRYADWSRKVWIEVYAPDKIFNSILLGETIVNRDEEEKVFGRKIELNLAFITGNFKYQNYKAKFKINRLSGGKLYSELVELSLYDSYIRRISRKETSKIDDSFILKTKDDVEIRIKPLVITRFKANREQKTAIRKAYREFLESKVSTLDFYEVIEKAMNYEIQEEVRPILNKIFPIDRIEIRKIVRLSPIKMEVPS